MTEDIEEFANLSGQQKALLRTKKKLIARSRINRIPKTTIKALKGEILSYNLNLTDMSQQEKISHVLNTFNVRVNVEQTIQGPNVDTYLLKTGSGVSVKSVKAREQDIALAVGSESVRVGSLTKVNGDVYIPVEVPTADRKYPALPSSSNIAIGVNAYGYNIEWDPKDPSTPHLLIAGATGSGKSVLINNILQQAQASGYELVIIDPKHELGGITNMKEIQSTVERLVAEMDHAIKNKYAHKTMLVFDEIADIVVRNKDVEASLLLLSQKARSAGIHLVLASQRISTKILRGDLKANFATRVCLTTASSIDSMVMLGEAGAEQLTGKGDALFISPDHKTLQRIQCYA
jgi:S-DNA-T family DNA segregation ATPase FtsK/SpoIIIE